MCLLHVCFDLRTVDFNTGWVGKPLGGAQHVVLADVIELHAVWTAVFDFEVANGFESGRVRKGRNQHVSEVSFLTLLRKPGMEPASVTYPNRE